MTHDCPRGPPTGLSAFFFPALLLLSGVQHSAQLVEQSKTVLKQALMQPSSQGSLGPPGWLLAIRQGTAHRICMGACYVLQALGHASVGLSQCPDFQVHSETIPCDSVVLTAHARSQPASLARVALSPSPTYPGLPGPQSPGVAVPRNTSDRVWLQRVENHTCHESRAAAWSGPEWSHMGPTHCLTARRGRFQGQVPGSATLSLSCPLLRAPFLPKSFWGKQKQRYGRSGTHCPTSTGNWYSGVAPIHVQASPTYTCRYGTWRRLRRLSRPWIVLWCLFCSSWHHGCGAVQIGRSVPFSRSIRTWAAGHGQPPCALAAKISPSAPSHPHYSSLWPPWLAGRTPLGSVTVTVTHPHTTGSACALPCAPPCTFLRP